MLSMHRYSKESNKVKSNITISCIGWECRNRTTCAVYQRGITCLSLRSLACVWLWFGKTGTCCRCDGECWAPGEERVMTVFNLSPWHRPAVHLTTSLAKKKDRTLNPATEPKDDHTWNSGSWEEGSEVHACGGESTGVDVWMDTKVMFSWAVSPTTPLQYLQSYCTPLYAH